MVFALFLILGIAVSYQSDSYAIAVISLLLLMAGAVFLYWRYKGLLFILAGVVLFYSIGSFEYLVVKNSVTGRFQKYDGREVTITGMIRSFPDEKNATTAYVIGVERLEAEGAVLKVKGKILLSVLKAEDVKSMDYGRMISVKGELTIPKGQRNPGGFNYRAYLAGNGVSATVFTTQSNITYYNKLGANFMESSGLAIRNKIIETINRSLPRQQAGLLNGMLIGYREGLDKKVQSVFSDAGLSHIMAVSGANVVFIILPLLFLLQRARVGRAGSNLIIIGVLVLFVYVTGFEPSVLRAVVMAIVMLLGRIILRDAEVYTSIALAAIGMLIYNPLLLFNIGFQLSFAATLSLVLFYTSIKNSLDFKFMPELIADVLAATLAAQIGVLPVSLFHFNQISLIAVLSNLLVVPLTQFVTILGFAMAFIGQFSLFLSELIGYVNCSLLSFILYITKVTAAVPFAVLKVPTPSWLFIIGYYAVVVFLLWYKPLFKPVVRLEYYVYSAAVFLAILMLPLLIPKGLEMVFLDVGQGDSTFIRTAGGKTILVDGGGFSSRTNTDTTMGDTVVIPFLLDQGVAKLDLVIATHGHDDHVQGLLSVVKSFPVGTLVVPNNPGLEKEFKDLLAEAAKRKIPVRACEKGDRITMDPNTFFEVLHPKKGYEREGTSLNLGSIVLKLDYKDTEVLLTGDMEEEVEKILLEDGVDLQSDFLKVAHHGSTTSSSEAFIAATKAKGGVISVGKNNYGHPAGEVIERLEDRSMKVFRTDRDGGIVLRSKGKNIKIYETVTVKR